MNTMTRAYPELKGTDRVREDCLKCGGKGRIPYYGHVDGGICYECDGVGYHMVQVRSIRARETRARKLDAEALHRRNVRSGSLVWVCACKVCEAERGYIAAQVKAEEARKAEEAAKAAREAAERTAATPVPEGREVVTGEVLGFKFVPGYAYNTEVCKMLVKDDRGFKVYGTQPAAFRDVQRGERVTFTAQLERSKDDELFGFFKRPTKAATL